MRRLVLVDISDDCVKAHPDKCVCCPGKGVFQERGFDEWIPCCMIFDDRSRLDGSYEEGFVRLPECKDAEHAADVAMLHATQEIRTQWQIYCHYPPGRRKRDELAKDALLLGIELEKP